MEIARNYEEMHRVYENGKDLNRVFAERLPKITKEVAIGNRGGYDKHRQGFQRNQHSVQSLQIGDIEFISFSGKYGDSSTYSDVAGIDSNLFKKYFLDYLNRHQSEIMLEIAADMMKSAAQFKEDALKELETMRQDIENMTEDHI